MKLARARAIEMYLNRLTQDQSAETHLHVAVISQAFFDATSDKTTLIDQSDAISFLLSKDRLGDWCFCLDIDPEVIAEMATKFLAAYRGENKTLEQGGKTDGK